jgi:hypothetical protein
MITSPFSIKPLSSTTVSSVGFPAGTITQAARGFFNFPTRSFSELAGVAPALANSFTESALRAYTTHSCFPFISRRTMLPPMRPSPIIAICMSCPPQKKARPVKV